MSYQETLKKKKETHMMQEYINEDKNAKWQKNQYLYRFQSNHFAQKFHNIQVRDMNQLEMQ